MITSFCCGHIITQKEFYCIPIWAVFKIFFFNFLPLINSLSTNLSTLTNFTIHFFIIMCIISQLSKIVPIISPSEAFLRNSKKKNPSAFPVSTLTTSDSQQLPISTLTTSDSRQLPISTLTTSDSQQLPISTLTTSDSQLVPTARRSAVFRKNTLKPSDFPTSTEKASDFSARAAHGTAFGDFPDTKPFLTSEKCSEFLQVRRFSAEKGMQLRELWAFIGIRHPS